MFKKLVFHVAHFVGQVVKLINESPRVEGNNITVDLQTDHPVRCSIRLATMSSPLRDCEHFLALSSTYYIAIVYLEASECSAVIFLALTPCHTIYYLLTNNLT